ncbi:MAG: phosphoribosyltransferase [Pseudomonadota bacterium]
MAEPLSVYRGRSDVIVLALPRGGVPVAFAVARALDLPLDVFLVRKLGVPGYEEFAMGAVASGGLYVLKPDTVEMFGIDNHVIDEIIEREMHELERREKLYCAGRMLPDLQGRTIILVDDGLATGSTMLAAVSALREKKPARLVVAVPVAAADTCSRMRAQADDVICLRTPEPFNAVGQWYRDFTQTSDEEVKTLLAQAQDAHGARFDAPGAVVNKAREEGGGEQYRR